MTETINGEEIDLNLYHRILAWLDCDNVNCKHASEIVRHFGVSFNLAYNIYMDYRRMRNM